MTVVVLEETDRLEWAIKHFRRQVQRSGILRDVKKKRYYVKPSTAKRLKAASARRRLNRMGRRGRS